MSQALTHCWGHAKESVFKALTFWASSAIRNNCSDAAPSSQQASIYVPEHSCQCPLIRGPGQISDCLKLQEQLRSMLCFSQIHPAVFCPSVCLFVSILASYALSFQNFNFWNYSSASGPSVVFTMVLLPQENSPFSSWQAISHQPAPCTVCPQFIFYSKG